MGSLAIWAQKRDMNIQKAETEVHVNFFIDYNRKDKPMLDFGLKVKNVDELSAIYLYIPYTLPECVIQDLGEILSNKKEVLNALFNENFEVKNINIPKYSEVQKEEHTVFYIYSLDVAHDIDLSFDYDGTILKIIPGNLPEKVQNADIYYRFRITDWVLENIKVNIKQKDAVLLSTVVRQSFIDFRFNDYKSLNQSLLELINDKENVPVKLSKLHFLLVTRADVNVDSAEAHTERALETDIWGQYFNNMSKPLMVANHWKRKPKAGEYVDNAIIYVKFRENICSWGTICSYLLALGALSIIFNLLTEAICQLF